MKTLAFTLIISFFSYNLWAEKGTHQHSHHQHQQLDVSGLENIPAIKIKLQPDAKSGWNLQIITENFEFAPDQVNQPHQMGKGHAHLYIDGKKIGRLYAHWRHISALSVGKHQIKVTLNTNDHQDYAKNGVVIGAALEIMQK